MEFRFQLFFCLLIFSTLMVVPIPVYGEIWEVEIPSGAANPEGPAHFLPTEISIRPGDKVLWGNADTVTHTVTSGTLELGVTERFDSGHMAPGNGFSVFFDEEDLGEIKYFCTIHPWMIGIVNVVDLPANFQILHNVGSYVSDSPIDVAYKVQRHLVSIDVDPVRNSLTFNFEGKISNDEFTAQLPEKLIQDPNAVWINDKQTTNYEITKTDGTSTLTIVLGDDVEQVKVVGTDVIGKKTPKEVVLINQIFGITDKKIYEIDDEITLSGKIQNPVQLYEISLDVISSNESTVYHKIIPLIDSTKFTEIIPTSGTLREPGEYTIKISGPDVKSLFLSFEYGIEPEEVLPLETQSPKKQIKSGIYPGDVTCGEGLKLLMKNSNGNAVCVTESTADALMIRGYADYF